MASTPASKNAQAGQVPPNPKPVVLASPRNPNWSPTVHPADSSQHTHGAPEIGSKQSSLQRILSDDDQSDNDRSSRWVGKETSGEQRQMSQSSMTAYMDYAATRLFSVPGPATLRNPVALQVEEGAGNGDSRGRGLRDLAGFAVGSGCLC